MLGEVDNAGNVKYLLYDGQGSVRHHTDSAGNLIAYSGCDTFAYDAYGHRIDPLADTINEGLFYTGEMHDSETQNYYLRARYYDPLTGRFNRMDDYAGNMQDPQSLHKYLYVHNNPVNAIDPTGRFAISGNMALGLSITALVLAAVGALWLYHRKRRDYGKYIGPEIGFWLYDYMKHVEKQARNLHGSAGTAFMFNNGGDWTSSGLPTKPPPENAREVQSVKIFKHVVPSDVGGNIMYGFIGRITGHSLSKLKEISNKGDYKQGLGELRFILPGGRRYGGKIFRGDEPEDIAATTFGHQLADEYMDSVDGGIDWERLTLVRFWNEFCLFPDKGTLTQPCRTAGLQEHSPPFVLDESAKRW